MSKTKEIIRNAQKSSQHRKFSTEFRPPGAPGPPPETIFRIFLEYSRLGAGTALKRDCATSSRTSCAEFVSVVLRARRGIYLSQNCRRAAKACLHTRSMSLGCEICQILCRRTSAKLKVSLHFYNGPIPLDPGMGRFLRKMLRKYVVVQFFPSPKKGRNMIQKWSRQFFAWKIVRGQKMDQNC